MRIRRARQKIVVVALICVFICLLMGCEARTEGSDKIPVKVLILPKFEVGEMSGDFPGEAQNYYEAYLEGGKVYDLRNGSEGTKIYEKDGVVLCNTGMGKVNTTMNLCALLFDDRFDFFDAYIMSTGCAGSAKGYSVMGDVYVVSGVADYDLGHHADSRDMSRESVTTWFHDRDFDAAAAVELDQKITDRVYELTKDVKLETTEKTVKSMEEAFPGETWAQREPKVLKGTAITSDNYWKGEYDHANAMLITKTYGLPDPYAVTEMEDIAICNVLKSYGMLDRLFILRDGVDMDVFWPGMTPESLWGGSADNLASEESEESADIFPTAMENNFKVGKVVIDAILDGSF